MQRVLVLVLVLVAGCHRVFGTDLGTGDDAPGDGGGGDAVDAPPCEAWFDVTAKLLSQTLVSPTAMKIGKFNADSVVDLAVTSSTVPGVFLMRAQGDGLFEEPAALASSSMLFGTSLAVGDLDADGDDDVVIGTAGGSVETFRINGSGHDAYAFPVGSATVVPALINYNGDNVVDLVVVNTGGDEVRFYAQNASPGFDYDFPVATGKGPVALAVGEFDGASPVLEVATVNPGDGTFSLVADEGMAFDARTPSVGADPRSIAFGRVDSDDLDDIVIGKTSEQIEIIYGNMASDIALTPVVIPFATITGLEVADLDGDGSGELVVLDRPGAIIYVISAAGTASEVRIPHAVPTEPIAIAVGDFTSDQRPDLAVVDAAGVIRTYPNCR